MARQQELWLRTPYLIIVAPNVYWYRTVQKELLKAGAFLMPYSDVHPESRAFNAIQRIGATGILKGEGKNIGLENHTHFYPDSSLTTAAPVNGLKGWVPEKSLKVSSPNVSYTEALEVIKKLTITFGLNHGTAINQQAKQILNDFRLVEPNPGQTISREVFSVLLDELINPFDLKGVYHLGNFYDN